MFIRLGLVMAVVFVAVMLINARTVPLRRAPRMLLEQGLIEPADLWPVAVATERLRRWRLAGAVLGVLGFGTLSVLAWHGLTLSLLALLAGAIAGLTAAEWVAGRHVASGPRSASLEHRTLAGVIGRGPLLVLLALTVCGTAALTTFLAKTPHSGGQWTVTTATRTCVSMVASTSGLLRSWTLALVAAAFALVAAVSVIRRGRDGSIPEAADDFLRRTGARGAVGGAISVIAAQTGATLLALPHVLQTPCAIFDGTPLSIELISFAGLGCYLVAVRAFVGMVWTVSRRPTRREVAVPSRHPVS